jgi:Skp family chaperone for outer membrane proteins
MRAPTWTALIALFALTLAGCGWKSDSPRAETPGAVAIIDLDEIARRLGSDRQISSLITQRQNALTKQLVELAKKYNAQIDEQKAKLTSPEGQPAENFDVTVASWQQQASASLTQVKQRAEADLTSTRLQLVNQFRDRIKPAARRVAQERGLSVIVTKNDGFVFDYVSTADITDAVVDELLATAPATTAPAAPIPQPAAQAMPQQQSQATAPPTAQQAAAPAQIQR